jgi:hypothetical protein
MPPTLGKRMGLKVADGKKPVNQILIECPLNASPFSHASPQRSKTEGRESFSRPFYLLIRPQNTASVPHPFPRLLRKWMGNYNTINGPDQ